MRKELNIRQLAFCNCYLLRGTGGECYSEAYGIESKEVAQASASQLLKKPNVQAYLQKHRRAVEKKTKVTTEKLINELVKVGFANIADYLDPGNTVKDVTSLKRKKSAAVHSVKTRKRRITTKEGAVIESEEVELKLHDKLSAIRTIGDHLGSWKAGTDEPQDETTQEIKITIVNKPSKDETES